MISKRDELVDIIVKFAESGWDVIDVPLKAWLKYKDNNNMPETIKLKLIRSIKEANEKCGKCGCEYDDLYKRALVLLKEV